MLRTQSKFSMLLTVHFAIVFLLIPGFAVDANAQDDVNPDVLKELTEI